MFLSLVKISPASGRENEVLEILLSVRGPTLAVSGCLECSIYQEHDDEQGIVYLEKWQSAEEMFRHIGSDLYVRVLKAIEFSDREPEIWFHEIAATRGMELIESVRTSKARQQEKSSRGGNGAGNEE